MLIGINSIFAQVTPADIVYVSRIDTGIQAPLRLAVDKMDNRYVTDAKTNSVFKYDVSGNLLENFVTGGSPISLAINSNNQIYIGEEGGRIIKIDANGSTTVFYTDTIYPSDMTFSPDNLLYIVDSKSKRVIVLDVSGKMIQSFGLGTLIYPTSIAYDAKNERVFVGEHGGINGGFTATCKVWVFDLLGNQTTFFGRGGNGNGKFYRIQGVAIGKCGNIYVNDPYQGNVSIFNESLAFITKFGVYGDSISELNLPMDVVFDSQERILVTSMNNGAIEIFNVSDTLPTSSIINSDATICAGDSTAITVGFTGTAPWNFTYTINGTNPTTIITSANPYTFNVSTAGVYEITALSDASYSGTCFTGAAIIKVNSTLPTSNMISPNDTVCEGTAVTIEIDFTGISPWTFTYSLDGFAIDTITTTDSAYSLPVSANGLYEVTSLYGNGCPGTIITGSTNLTVRPLPLSTFTDGINQIYICEGDTFDFNLVLTGTAPWTFTYNLDESNPLTVNTSVSPYILSVFNPGVYEVIEITDTFCTSTITEGFPEIVFNERPTATFANIDTSFCERNYVALPVTFTGSGPWDISYTYNNSSITTVLNTFDNPFIIDAYQSGSYQIFALTDSLCNGALMQGLATITVNPPPTASFSFTDDSVQVSFFNTSVDANSYTWDFGDNLTDSLINPIHTYLSSGSYVVALTATNLCGNSTAYDTVNFYLVSVDEALTIGEVNIYPNPTNGNVYLEINNINQANIKLEVFDITGKAIYKQNYNSNIVSDRLDLSSFSDGVYLIRLIEGDNMQTVKLILKK